MILRQERKAEEFLVGAAGDLASLRSPDGREFDRRHRADTIHGVVGKKHVAEQNRGAGDRGPEISRGHGAAVFQIERKHTLGARQIVLGIFGNDLDALAAALEQQANGPIKQPLAVDLQQMLVDPQVLAPTLFLAARHDQELCVCHVLPSPVSRGQRQAS